MPWPASKAPSSAASSAGGGALAKAAQQRASQYARGQPGAHRAQQARPVWQRLDGASFFRSSGGADDSLARACKAPCHQQNAKVQHTSVQ